jgi:hypothetical protein
MQIGWGQREVLKFAGIGKKRRRRQARVWERESMVENRCERGCEVGIGTGARRTRAARGEPCRVCELWVSRFMLQ